MAKGIYVGVGENVPIYEEKTETINIDSTNILSFFKIENGSYYFVGEGNTFTTNNSGVNSSTASTKLTALQDISSITFDYSYSSESNYDKFTLKVAGTTIENAVSGATTSKSYTGELSKGKTIELTYAKDSSQHKNNDECTFSNMIITSNVKMQIGSEYKELARTVKKIYIGIDNIARKVKKGYIGVDGVARLFFNCGGKFVCVGASGKSYSSADGTTWTAMSGLNTSYTYEGVTYGNDRFVCVGNSGSSYYSTDAATWIAMTGLTSKSFTSVAYGNGIFVCVGADGYSYYSTNGTSWTAITRLASDYIYGVTYGNDRFVCVGEGGLIYYSTTGKKWTKASGPYVTSLNSVTYGDGRFVCVGTQGKSYYSTDDGATWTSMSGLSTSSSYSSVTYGNGRFVCTGSAGRSYYSTNGTSWKAMSGLTAKDAYGDLSYGGVTYGNDRFVCVGINGYSFYSTDGLTWNAMSGLPNSTSADFYEVAYAEI